jgi:peptide/nickel transport system substrate-binding protein
VSRSTVVFSLSCSIVFLLVLTSCGPTAVTTTATTTPPTTTAAPATTAAPVTTPPSDKPRYGGAFTAVGVEPTNFDSGLRGQSGGLVETVYEQYMGSDWTRGPAGSGVTNFASGANTLEDTYGPYLAESWTTKEVGVWVLEIRQGVRWQKVDSEAGRLMSGRVMTADDVVSSFKRLLAVPTSWMNVGQPRAAKAASIEKTGPWQVTIRTPVDPMTSFTWLIQGAGFNRVYPPEVVAKYGDMGDWRNAVGTGPFILKDYVVGSSMTFVRNPDYWGTNPVGPGKGDRLPYVNSYKELYVPDLSTRLAGFRTGKIDVLAAIVKDDAQNLLRGNAKIMSVTYMENTPWGMTMRTDKQDLPFKDKKVRQALVMATDYKAFNAYFGGDSDYDVWPINKQVSAMYEPLSKMPQVVQDLYKYNPDKAKQLLKEAGYPNGFKTTVVVPTQPITAVDEVTVFKEMWSKVGVDVAIDLKEPAVYNSMNTARNNAEMSYRLLWGAYAQQLYFSPFSAASTNNPSYVNDPAGTAPFYADLYNEVGKYLFVDMPKAYEAYRKLKPVALDDAWYIMRPTPNTYILWWPWLKNYHGQGNTLFRHRQSWIDQELKASTGY